MNEINQPIGAAPEFYVVSMGKFTILFLSTLGLYTLYWFYRNWELQKQSRQESTVPIARAILSPFFVRALFDRVHQREREQNISYPWQPFQLALLYIGSWGTKFAYRIKAAEGQLALGWHLGILLLFLVDFYVLYKVQLVINRVAGDPFGRQNDSYSLQNKMWIIFGLTMWMLNLQGLYLMATGQLETAPAP